MTPLKLTVVFLVIALSACSTSNRFKIYYSDYGNNALLESNPYLSPKLIETFDIKGKVSFYENQNYVVLGVSSFDGEWEPRTKAIDFAREIGASLIITESNHTGDIAKQYSISVPTTNTSYHSGSVYTNYGTGATYTGTTTTHGSQQISASYSIGQYEQETVFMVKEENDNVSN